MPPIHVVIENISSLSEPKYLEFAQIIGIVITFLGTVATFFTLLFYFRQFNETKKLNRYEKAIQYINKCSEEILPIMHYTWFAYKRCIDLSILKKFVEFQFKDFNKKELEEILNPHEITSYKNAFSTKDKSSLEIRTLLVALTDARVSFTNSPYTYSMVNPIDGITDNRKKVEAYIKELRILQNTRV